MFNLKIFILIAILSIVNSNAARLRSSSRLRTSQQKFERQELLTTTTQATPEEITTLSNNEPEPTTTASNKPSLGGPYQPSGWKPSGRSFLLPTEIEERQIQPNLKYGPPSNSYGPPVVNSPDVNDIEIEDPDSISIDAASLVNDGEIPKHGSYFVRLSDGSLQKIIFSPAENSPVKIVAQPLSAFKKSEKLRRNPVNGFSLVRGF
ncbi:uncharacterized protein LOC129618678 [Condylostylus longicornis]|uniref:uncharacterized protein LOC129618678 n=1 Tax=Condylostylus longicornis TaxID=2530218 RepID=UPI00244DFB88|nr:uncharacterized protein LOC129618678 [Condylostylus longicornis]